ncbi:hypothetical protein DP939_44355 [Spongiactinospora rosea]|uniref:Uncharacterized protein n=1 Tax=Spongiactinospora rosea TaxID=2248750 RepID=A0A366LEI4_9ACTN|nr:hypothetical protein DP939_44355 [Spongiactinospora rosea]
MAFDRAELSLLASMGRAGLVLRGGQIHVTAALVAAITGYRCVDPGSSGDHYGVGVNLDLSKIGRSCLRTYT